MAPAQRIFGGALVIGGGLAALAGFIATFGGWRTEDPPLAIAIITAGAASAGAALVIPGFLHLGAAAGSRVVASEAMVAFALGRQRIAMRIGTLVFVVGAAGAVVASQVLGWAVPS